MLNNSIFNFYDEDYESEVTKAFKDYFYETMSKPSKHSDDYYSSDKKEKVHDVNNHLIFIKHQILDEESDNYFADIESYLYKKASLNEIHTIFSLIGVQ